VLQSYSLPILSFSLSYFLLFPPQISPFFVHVFLFFRSRFCMRENIRYLPFCPAPKFLIIFSLFVLLITEKVLKPPCIFVDLSLFSLQLSVFAFCILKLCS
jgi:hypothetical protein